MKYLEKADLSSNRISFIEEGAFRNLAYMKTLDLSNNRCEYFSIFLQQEQKPKLDKEACLINGNTLFFEFNNYVYIIIVLRLELISMDTFVGLTRLERFLTTLSDVSSS